MSTKEQQKCLTCVKGTQEKVDVKTTYSFTKMFQFYVSSLQDFNAFCSYMNQYPRDKFLQAVSDFHVLVYLATCDMLPVGVSVLN